jgi:peroxiredoxin family protein
MSTDLTSSADEPSAGEDIATLESRIEDLESELADLRAAETEDSQQMVIIATKGTLDMAYPPLILASTAAAFGWNVTVFHTFWGLEILHEDHSKDLQLSSVGNPNLPIPNAIAALPGMDRMTSKFMAKRIADNDVATVEELIQTSLEAGVDLQACQMTIDLLDYNEDEFYDSVETGVGAASAFQRMTEADVQLLV